MGLVEAKALRRLAIVLIAVPALSCRSPEHELVDRFLAASLRGDDQTVALLSMVSFPVDVTDYRVVTLGEERRGPYRVLSVRERVEEAEDRRDEQYKIFSEFRRANYDDLLAIQRQLAEPQKKLEGRQGELQRQWNAFREEQEAVAASLRDAERELRAEVRTLQKSLQKESPPEELQGEMVTKIATVRVTTKEDGERTYLVTITRYDLKNSFGAVVPTRWIVTGVEAAS